MYKYEIISDRMELADSAAKLSSTDVEMTDVSTSKDTPKKQNYLDDSQKTLIIALLERYCRFCDFINIILF